jgi:hypothetical protein
MGVWVGIGLAVFFVLAVVFVIADLRERKRRGGGN